ncbi:MAG: MinD/ParA family protein [Halieaceae bacterium]
MPKVTQLAEQARGLSRLSQPDSVRVVAVTSGKGGVGKSNLSVNLSSVFAQRKQSVVLMDADLGLANVDLFLGVRPQYDLQHVISGERSLEEIMVETAQGIRVIPAASGVQSMAELSPAEHAGLIRAFSELSIPVDVLIIDTAAGISDSVVSFSHAAQEVIVVVCDEPASITDAYALMKVLNRDNGVNRFQIVTNMVKSASQGLGLYEKLAAVAGQYLNCSVGYLGHVPFDDNLRLAVRRQQPVVDGFPESKSALALKQIADRIESLPVPPSSGYIEFFLERMVAANSSTVGAGR